MDWSDWAGVIAAAVGGLLTLMSAIGTSNRAPKGYRKLVLQADLLSKLPEGTEARRSLQQLLDDQIGALASREKSLAPLNPTNVTLTVILGGGLSYGCYLLWLWANSAEVLGWLAWTVFVIALLITVLFIGGAIGTIRNPSTKSTNLEASDEDNSS